MAEKRREESERRSQRERSRLCEEARDEFKTTSARRRQEARLILRSYGRYEKEIDGREGQEGPELSD